MAETLTRLVAAQKKNRPPTTKNVTRLAIVRLFISRSCFPSALSRASRVLLTGDGPHVDLGELQGNGLGQGVDELVEEVDDGAQLLCLGSGHGEDAVDLLDLLVDVLVVLVQHVVLHGGQPAQLLDSVDRLLAVVDEDLGRRGEVGEQGLEVLRPAGERLRSPVEVVDDRRELLSAARQRAADGGQVSDQTVQLRPPSTEGLGAGLYQRGHVAAVDGAEQLDGRVGDELELGGLLCARHGIAGAQIGGLGGGAERAQLDEFLTEQRGGAHESFGVLGDVDRPVEGHADLGPEVLGQGDAADPADSHVGNLHGAGVLEVADVVERGRYGVTAAATRRQEGGHNECDEEGATSAHPEPAHQPNTPVSDRATPRRKPPRPPAASAAFVAGSGLTTPTFAPPLPNSLRMLSMGLGGAAVVDVVAGAGVVVGGTGSGAGASGTTGAGAGTAGAGDAFAAEALAVEGPFGVQLTSIGRQTVKPRPRLPRAWPTVGLTWVRRSMRWNCGA